LKNLRAIILAPLILLASLFTVPGIPYAHAATGLVCLAEPSDTACPAYPPSFTQALGALLNVTVRIQGSDSLNGFDIQVMSDPTILIGVDAYTTGSVLSFTTLVRCINGMLKAGSSCAPQDGLGVIHLAAVTFGSASGAPVSGLLFTAVFKVLAASSGVPISFNTGCAGTSVSNTCVSITNGTPGSPPVPQTIQEATFSFGEGSAIATNGGVSTTATNPRSVTYLVWESGLSLSRCGPLGCNYGNFYGVSGEIDIYNQNVSSGQSKAYWVSVDYPFGGAHYWFQAGYLLGEAPDSNFYSSPVIYGEYNGLTYNFRVLNHPSFGSQHSLKLWIVTNGTGTGTIHNYGNIMLDSTLVEQFQLPDGFTTGLLSAMIEVHGFVSPEKNPMAHWSQLRFEASPSFPGGWWLNWGDNIATLDWTHSEIQITTPYWVNTVSQTEFYVFLFRTGGGGTMPRM